MRRIVVVMHILCMPLQFCDLFLPEMEKKEYLCSVKQIFKTLSVYGIAYIALLVLVFGLQYAYPELELHLLLNSHHTGAQDTFFKYFSTLAEWPLYLLALLPVFWKKVEMTIFFALSELSGGAVIQLLKFIFYAQRPSRVFESHPDLVLPVVQGVDLHHSNSFPSGHASTFFIFCTCCALLLAYHYHQKTKPINHNKWLLLNLSMLMLLMLAALGAFSRIYLSQHFLWDVSIGSIIGFVTPCLVFYYGRGMIHKLADKLCKRT